MITFLLIVNKRGQARVRRHYRASASDVTVQRHEAELIRKCLTRDERECSFFEHRDSRVVCRRYASMYFILGLTEDENELGVWEFINNIVETFNEYFKRLTELDIMLNVDRVNMILDEMISGGQIVEASKARILAPLKTMDQSVGEGGIR